jgi:hypothetical protein
VTPGAPPRRVLAVVPLYYDSLGGAQLAGPLALDVPAGATAGRLELRATGHGGADTTDPDCRGPAEEFCHRSLTVAVDGEALDPADPWRGCEAMCTTAHYGSATGGFDYCAENPYGNMLSVVAPRANWCPGSLTEPFVFEPARLATPGPHTLDWTIGTQVVAGGSWRLSATYFAYGD